MSISRVHWKKMAGITALSTALISTIGCQDLKPKEGQGNIPEGASGAQAGGGPKVKLEFFVMSKCPYGSQVEEAIKPVIDELGQSVDLNINFIGTDKNGTITSMHGESEVQGNIIQLCAIKHYPDAKKYLAFISCQNKSMRTIPTNWETCATQSGLDVGTLKTCYEGKEGKDLLKASVDRANKRGARGSPTIYLAGEAYQGGRSKNDFMRALCGKMTGTKPAACAKIPEPVQVTALVLTDKRCAKCAHQGLAGNLRSRFFPKLDVKAVDYNTDEGKRLFTELKIEKLPVWLFEKGVEKAERYSTIQRWMSPLGKYLKLQVPATFDPKAEICDNKIDDTANGKIDCADPTCTDAMACRPEKKNAVDVFVMSQCPYGVKALDAAKEVIENFKGKLAFDVHYIADENSKTPSGFSALHGEPEVRENIRQLCAKKYYARGNKYLDYIWCRNKNIRSEEWKSCATGGISAAKIERCSTGSEGKRLLSRDLKIAKALNISGSPTWLANNRFKFSGIAANAIKSNICQRNPTLPNCSKELTKKAANVPAGSCN